MTADPRVLLLISWLPGLASLAPLDAARELRRFPTSETAEERIAFHQERDRWIDRQALLWPEQRYADYWHAASNDNLDRHLCWVALRNAQLADCGHCKIFAASLVAANQDMDAAGWLEELRRRLDPHAYQLGQMPGPIALEFTRPIP